MSGGGCAQSDSCAAGGALTFLVLAQRHHFGLVDGDFDERGPHLGDLHLLLVVGQLLGVLRTQENEVTEPLLKKFTMLSHLASLKLPPIYTIDRFARGLQDHATTQVVKQKSFANPKSVLKYRFV